MPNLPRLGLILSFALLSACQGQSGPAGLTGTNGNNGNNGSNGGNGLPGCDGLAGGAAATLDVHLTASAPTSGAFFAAGQQPVLTIQVIDRCGRVVPPSALGELKLYLAGPRAATLTKTASKLLNAVTNRSAADRQHHYVNLKSPSYADPARINLAAQPDGTLTYTLSPVSDEPAGTYTAGLWVLSADGLVQALALADLQVGTATVESYASGAPATSTCRSCHLGARSGRVDLQHAFASVFLPTGAAALDQAPVASCQLCHNLDGFSAIPTARKVHGLHRGSNQSNAGVAHPEYGLGDDVTLAAFTNVRFPSMPGAERDCVACHADDRWTSRPSRLGCGTCHDNLFFDTGTLSPPRLFGQPSAGPCAAAPACAAFGALATCDTVTGTCVRASHPTQADDTACSVCHTADPGGVSPVAARHEIYARTRTTGLALSNVLVTGGSGPGGAFQVGDVPVLSFGLADQSGPVLDLKTNATLAATALLGGPVEARQRVFGPLTNKSALSGGDASGHYTYTFPAGWPANALLPFNATAGSPTTVNPTGSYTVHFYVNRAVTVAGQTFRETTSSTLEVPFGGATATRARQVVTTAACNGCHGQLQAHGGARVVAEACGLCHTDGAVDRTVGSLGAACTSNAECPGFPVWESCQDTTADGQPDTCVVTVDPTPNATIAFGPMAHSIHLGRRLGGYAERNDLVAPGLYQLLGLRNTFTDFSQGFLPQDPRNCTACHADAGNTCSSQSQCGAGQACRAQRCENVSWLTPTTPACLSCHDTAAATGHAALNTWTSTDGPVETCAVCHGPGAAQAVDLVHPVGAGVLPFARLP